MKGLLFLLVFVSTASFGQLKCCFFVGSGDSIHVANPSYNFHVARSGTAYSATITVPANYATPSWQIIDHGTQAVYSSGTSYSVPYTFTYGAGRNVYDLKVTATSLGGFTTLVRDKVAEFICLPALFTESTADRVYDLSTTGMGFHDESWTDHSTGYKIWVKGNNLASPTYFYLDDFKSSVDDKPIHIIFDNVTMYSNAGNFYLGPSQNVIIDGAKDEATYGINLVRNTGGTQDQNFTWYVTGNNGHDHPSYRTVICGISTTNVDHTIGGSAGIQISPSNTATYNRDTYVNDQILMFHCKTNWTSGEGFYINHFDDALHGGFAYSGSSNAWFFDNLVYNSANEGFQIGSCFGCEVFRNRWINTGVGNGTGQRNILQWSDGNRDLVTYQNYGETAKDIWSSFTGVRGKNMEAFSNVFYSTGPSAGDGINVFIKQKQSDTYASQYWGIYNNDFVMAGVSGTGIPFALYNAIPSPTTLFDSLVLADNIVVTNTATTYTTADGFDITNLYVNNYQVTNSALPLFIDFAGKNLDLSSPSSPAFRSLSTFVKRHWASAYDFQGYAFLAGHHVVGAYSGARLFTHSNPIPPVSFKVNFFTGTATGWITTGSTSPAAAAPTTVDYGQLGSTGVGLRALNNTNELWTGTNAFGGTGTTYPDAVHSTYWYNQATGGAYFELYEFTAGSLTGRTFTLKFLSSRTGAGGQRQVTISTPNGSPSSGSVDASNDFAVVGNDTLITLSGVTPVAGVIKVKVQYVPTNVTSAAWINGMEVDSE